ncbi:MAG TPA: DUF695 domain-containing protein [Kofleriaceae bacterium]|nr:DUF695 domain-containing protein [Kofleriaceae bacterium]
MGVIGSYCQLCRLPLSHDHYVQSASLGMLKIYRSTAEHGGHDWEPGERVVRFGREHRWLRDAIAITREETPRVVEGPVEDGVLEAGDDHVFIWEGDDDGFAYHRFCYERIGSPRTLEALVHGRGTHAASVVDTYGGQLFEFHELIDQGKGWMLVDPRLDTDDARRSRARIEEILAIAQRPRSERRPARVADVLAVDRDWRGMMLRGDAHAPRDVIRYRASVHPALDCAEYPVLVWAMKEYVTAGTALPEAAVFDELERFEHALKASVERDAAAILVMVTIGATQAQFLVHARDEAETVARIQALPSGPATKPIEFDNERDPAWNVYFSQMAPKRHGE